MTMHGRRAQQINRSCFQLLSPLSTVISILSGKKTFLYRSKNDLKKRYSVNTNNRDKHKHTGTF